jgi:ATP-dependent Zn protease
LIDIEVEELLGKVYKDTKKIFMIHIKELHVLTHALLEPKPVHRFWES